MDNNGINRITCPITKLNGQKIKYCESRKGGNDAESYFHKIYFNFTRGICQSCPGNPVYRYPSACGGGGLFQFPDDLSTRHCFYELGIDELRDVIIKEYGSD